MNTIILTDEELSLLSFALACREDDFKASIKKQEKKTKTHILTARQVHSDIQKLRLIKINPAALCDELKLMNGEIIKPVKDNIL